MVDLEAGYAQENADVATPQGSLERPWRWLGSLAGLGAGRVIGSPAESLKLLDCMEQGGAQSSAQLLTPLKRSSRLKRFHVLRSTDKLEYRLFNEAGDFILRADVSVDDSCVFFYTQSSSQPRSPSGLPLKPVFTMAFDKRMARWHLVNERCEHCQMKPEHLSCASRGKQQVAFVHQTAEDAGNATFRNMDVRIPGIFSDGSRVTWCAAMGKNNLGASPPEAGDEVQRLVALRPTWNSEVRSLVLEFKDRQVVSSAKNFQLALKQKPKHLLCQYAKLGTDTFALDCKFPLSIIQAFAISLTTAFWK